MTTDTNICCCSPFVGAGINAVLQLLCSVIGLSSTLLLTSREHFWKVENIVFESTTARPFTTATLPQAAPQGQGPAFQGSPQGQGPAFQGSPQAPGSAFQGVPQGPGPGYQGVQQGPGMQSAPQGTGYAMVELYTEESVVTELPPMNRLINTWIEMTMTWYIAFSIVWIFTIHGLFLSFRFYRPVLVVPNIVILLFGVFFNGSAFVTASIYAWLKINPKEFEERNQDELIFIYISTSFLVIFILNIIFISISFKYHSYLQQRHAVSPQKVFVRRKSPSNVSEDSEKN